MIVFRSRLDVVIIDRLGVWQFTAAISGLCLAFTLGLTIASDYFEGASAQIMAIDVLVSIFSIGVLASPLAYYAARSNLALYEAKCEAERSSLTDSLTGLMNRRAFLQLSEHGDGAQQALVVFDLDRFKRVNDLYGHQAGDRVIRQVAEALQSDLGALGRVARVGGEEFALLAPSAAYNELIVKLVDARAHIEAMPVAIHAGTVWTTISAGVALGAPGESFASLYRRADKALYEAKAAGRNCLRVSAGPDREREWIEAPKTAIPA